MRWPILGCIAASIVIVSIYAATVAPAAAPATTAPEDAGAVPPADKGRWVEISGNLLKSLDSQGKKIGYPGKVAGITADPTTGYVYMVVPDQGMFASADHGDTFTRIDGGVITGRCETGGTLQVDTAGKRIACFMLDGTGGMTLDGGKTWSKFASVGRNWDYAAVQWAAENPMNIFAMHHESGGELYLSNNAGKSWKKIAKDAKYSGVGIIDGKTLLTMKSSGGIFRSTDAGATWTQVADFIVTSHVPVLYKNALFLISKDGLITSADQGVTWTKHGSPVDATFGPIFKDEKQMIVWGKKGIYETKDAGDTWTLILKMPKEYNAYNAEWYNNVGWDPKADIFYISHMGLPAYRWVR